jgi:hypothetical protein
MAAGYMTYTYTFKNGDSRAICCKSTELLDGILCRTNAKTVEITEGITEIVELAFSACKNLTTVTIPSTVTSIGYGAFEYCAKLTSLTVKATNPPTLEEDMLNYSNNCIIYVPSASVNAYKSASGWSDYADRIQAIP